MTRKLSSFFSKTVALSAVVTLNLFAATTTKTTTSVVETTAVTPASSASGILGTIDIRPTWKTKSNTVGSENTLELGYQFNPNFKVIYEQDVVTNVYNSSGPGVNPQLDDSVLKAKIDNIWKNSKGDLSFSYEPRVYLPLQTGATANGMITTVRNYLKLKKDFNKSVSLVVAETPFIYFNNLAATPKGDANKSVGNRLIVELDVNLANNVTLAIPMWWQADLTRTSAGARNSNKVMHGLVVWPEVDFSVSKNITLGVAYRGEVTLSDNDTSKNGIEHYGQFVFNAKL